MPPTSPRLSPPQAASFAARASGFARNVFKLSLQTYVGVTAVAAGSYGAMAYAGHTMRGNAGGLPDTGPLVDLPTLQQEKVDLLPQHAPYIPSDSACQAIELRLAANLPARQSSPGREGEHPAPAESLRPARG